MCLPGSVLEVFGDARGKAPISLFESTRNPNSFEPVVCLSVLVLASSHYLPSNEDCTFKGLAFLFRSLNCAQELAWRHYRVFCVYLVRICEVIKKQECSHILVFAPQADSGKILHESAFICF